MIGEIKTHKLSEHEIKVWSDFITPDYVWDGDDGVYCYLKDEGFEKMEHVQRIITIKEATRRLN